MERPPLDDNVHLIFHLGAALHLDDDGTRCGCHGWEAVQAFQSGQEQ